MSAWLFHCTHRRDLWILDRVYASSHWADCHPLRLPRLPLVGRSWKHLLEATLLLPWQLLLESSIFLGNIKWKERVVLWKIDFHLSPLYLHLWPWQKAAPQTVTSPQSQNILWRGRGRELEVWYWFVLCVWEEEQSETTHCVPTVYSVKVQLTFRTLI